MKYYLIAEKDIPQAKPLMPMATDYRLGHKTADWIMGFNACRQEFMSKARVIDEEGMVEILEGLKVPPYTAGQKSKATWEVCRRATNNRIDEAICKFVEKG